MTKRQEIARLNTTIELLNERIKKLRKPVINKFEAEYPNGTVDIIDAEKMDVVFNETPQAYFSTNGNVVACISGYKIIKLAKKQS